MLKIKSNELLIIFKKFKLSKVGLTLLCLLFLTNCGQYSAMVGPSYTLVETGSVLQATNSYGRSYLFKTVKQNQSNEANNKRICQELHSSELHSIFFQTQDKEDCIYDPMSIYR